VGVSLQLVPTFLLTHHHTALECAHVFAAWRGFTSPLRHRDALSSCPQDMSGFACDRYVGPIVCEQLCGPGVEREHVRPIVRALPNPTAHPATEAWGAASRPAGASPAPTRTNACVCVRASRVSATRSAARISARTPTSTRAEVLNGGSVRRASSTSSQSPIGSVTWSRLGPVALAGRSSVTALLQDHRLVSDDGHRMLQRLRNTGDRDRASQAVIPAAWHSVSGEVR
jgi:hypothetical protein